MIILYSCLLLVLLHVALPGSDLRRLGALRLRHTWLIWVALLTQVVVISLLPDLDGLSAAVHLSTYVLALVFVLLNVRTAGTWLVAAGGAGNLVAIALNGGTMPADPDALRASGWTPAPGHFANSDVVAHPRVGWLGDVFHTPSWLPVHSVFSIGDVVVVVGIAVFLQQTCRPAESARRRRWSIAPGREAGRGSATDVKELAP